MSPFEFSASIVCYEICWLEIAFHFPWHVHMVFSVLFLSLSVRGLSKTIKRRQIFRWLHQQKPDVVFLQQTYFSAQNLKSWAAEWSGKMIGSEGTNRSRGVIILFKSKRYVNNEQIISDKSGRYQYQVLAEALVEGEKFVFLSIYVPNDQTQHWRNSLEGYQIPFWTIMLGKE